MKNYGLYDFQILRPRYETTQEDGLKWLAMAHAKAESAKLPNSEDDNNLYQQFFDKFWHIGCKPEHIGQRGHELPDFLHHNWSEMEVINVDPATSNGGLRVKQKFHDSMTDAIFEKFYPEGSQAPNHLIHVSCTGYSAPSSAQKVVSQRNWGEQTLVTHAYHMGCYASIPAIRMGGAFTLTEGGQADIVHTELCTVHFNPSNHNADQIVLQSLFADGYIKYSVRSIEELNDNETPHFHVIAHHEQLIPKSTEAMTWFLTDKAFEGSLSIRIPFLIAKNISAFIEAIAKKANLESKELYNNALFAIHPGGPKILDQIQEILHLQPEQLKYSRAILKKYGNISSGTLPHIWESILKDEMVKNGTLIVGLAFGPGLNIAGIVLKKTTS